MTEIFVPQGFDLMADVTGFGVVLQPIYRKVEDDAVIFAMQVQEKHVNSFGILHGGVSMTLGDFICIANIWHRLDYRCAAPTISLAFNFMNPASVGDWVYSQISSLELKRSTAFVSGAISTRENDLASFNGVFKIPAK